ncbi:NirD/YgiW/YdeI family stress tolerance protein [Testudinibacter sp. TR-2022]|uniref:YgiW/YdeI family stress tolerance OB fold protein n=1 Tax=Testudinibacter sp. TR-2022 TaxID=2585029 RepID=UPI00111A1F25|nr:NirD/YgiW/YdeI family stress tolerance protein [Testudinibacter sp. TR-2022]TNH05687.1 NirD/YgiW/YdeI family stress tolerance protein [Pasteurellaceae bacterium Phil31]TNH08353.1 NirD/YgiW/YdeI family stress tolerance protein [Testudinibacter sp. TR-2022]TNH10508.1 NirD/YgiW/YdeI family stress tolerance protein [Testudinibacter sp. TR-2022]TNH16206.1 NirD/YgiW/YdeI family stress tolerance protein [Testudinibacter sp. TR-2022]TNH17030.1 NirD/YgiW/YdeI family stress tolerance protein [Testudi
MKKLALVSALLVAISGTALAATQATETTQPTFGGERIAQKHDGKHRDGKTQRGGFNNEQAAAIKVTEVQNAKDDQPIVLEGFIEKQVGKDDYLFKDDSGSIEVEIERRAWAGQEITPNDKVKLFGEVDKSWNKTEVEIYRVIKVQ